MTVADDLLRAREIQALGHCKFFLAMGQGGLVVDPTDPNATAHCLNGALMAAIGVCRFPYTRFHAAHSVLARAMKCQTVDIPRRNNHPDFGHLDAVVALEKAHLLALKEGL